LTHGALRLPCERTQCQIACLLRPIATVAYVTAKLTTKCGLVVPKLIGNLCDALNGVNLISFDLSEVYVIYRATTTSGQETLNAKHPQPSTFIYLNVALRTLIRQ
jgi:hypothetical protein